MPADPTDTKDPNVMTEFTIETPAFRQAIATALAFASDDDTFSQINLVHVEPVESGVEIVATDRYALSVEQIDATGEPFPVNIPYEVAKRLLTLLPKPRRRQLIGGMVTVAKDGEKITVRLVGEFETAISFTPIDEEFVKYREFIDKAGQSKEEPAKLMAFAPPLLSRTVRALAARSSGAALHLHFSGANKPVLIQQDTLTVLLMPARVEPTAAKSAEVAA